MKILHINGNYAFSSLHRCMIRHLDGDGLENMVFVPLSHEKEPLLPPENGDVYCRCFRLRDRYFFPLKHWKICRAVRRSFPSERFDLIHAYTLFTDGNCARKLAKRWKIPYVVAVRNTDVTSFLYRKGYLQRKGTQIMRQAAQVLFLSESYRDSVLQRYVDEKYREEIRQKSVVIPNGIDPFWLEHEPEPSVLAEHADRVAEKRLDLIYAGAIDRNKNIATTQKAMSLLQKQGYDVHLTVVGPVKDKEVLQTVSSDRNTAVKKAMPKEELIDEYRASSMFVMPSRHESFGLVYAEALSQGLPVVYTRGQGFDRQFPEGEIGRSVKSRSAEEVAEAIVWISEHYPEISGRTVAAAKRFNWDSIVLQYRELYRSILKQE